MNYARNKKNVVRFHGLPDDVTSYRGPQLVSCVWRRLLQTRGKIVNLSSSYHPQTDGQIEWVSKILEQYLRCSHNYQQDDGIDLLPLAKFTYNNSLHGSTRVIPFFANYGFHHRLGTSIPGNTVNPSAEARAHTLVDIPQNLSLELILAGDQYTAQPCPSLQLVIKFGSYVVISTLLDLEESWTTRSWCLSASLRVSTSSFFGWNFLCISEFIISSMPLSLNLIIHPQFLEDTLHLHLQSGEEYEVDKILDSCWHQRQLQYMVLWKGYPILEATWEQAQHSENASHVVHAFHHQYPQKPRRHLRR